MRVNLNFLYRKKKYDAASLENTNLSRVLNLSDLVALGVSCTLGSGVYILVGNIIANYTGPSIILSFLIAGICSFLAGLCYAELGSRVPRSGSAYVYIYVTIGEFIAFIIGWHVILEYVIGTSTAASALSKYIDSLFENQISEAFKRAMPMYSDLFAPYPDWLAFGLAIFITLILMIGVKESSFMNTILTFLNIFVIAFIFVTGATKSHVSNWRLQVDQNTTWINSEGKETTCGTSDRCGIGGFAPFGLAGIIKGSAKCFYAYIGFDCIATTGEEVRNPKRNIPLSIVLTLLIVSLCYIGVSSVLTLMIPYYMLDSNIPLPQAFNHVGLNWASYFVSFGAILSLLTCLFASMFPMPRIVYAMASDGLIFRFLSYIMPTFKTPVLAALTTGLLAAFLVLIFDLSQLIDMMSIGTLLAYSLVSASTLVLRYRPTNYVETDMIEDNSKKSIISYIFGQSDEMILKRLFYPSSVKCSKSTAHLVGTITLFLMIDILILCLIINYADLKTNAAYAFLIIFLIFFVIFLFILWMQPQNNEIDTFKVPLVPFLPVTSSFLSIFLMTTLNASTWVRFLIWFTIGIVVYFTYGIRNSSENVGGNHQNFYFPCIEKSYAVMEDTPDRDGESTL